MNTNTAATKTATVEETRTGYMVRNPITGQIAEFPHRRTAHLFANSLNDRLRRGLGGK